MEPQEFVIALRERVIENDNRIYQNLLDNTAEAKDPLWIEVLSMYKSLTKEQRVSFVSFIRMIQVNTLSHMLGILDGSTYLSQDKENFILKTGKSEEPINGDLQDIFLGMEEG